MPETFWVPTEVRDLIGVIHYLPGHPNFQGSEAIYWTGDTVDGQGFIENVVFTDADGNTVADPDDLQTLVGGWVTMRDPVAEIQFTGNLSQGSNIITNVNPVPEESWLGKTIVNDGNWSLAGSREIIEIDPVAGIVVVLAGQALETESNVLMTIPGGVIVPVFGNLLTNGLNQYHIVRNIDFSGGNRRIYMLGTSFGDREGMKCSIEAEVTDPLSIWFYGMGPASNVKLDGAINAAVTTINVEPISGTDPIELPESGNYPIKVDNEQMLVTGGQGTTTLTVTRGYAGTSAASHNNNRTVNAWPSPKKQFYFYGKLTAGSNVITEVSPAPLASWVDGVLQNEWLFHDLHDSANNPTPFTGTPTIQSISAGSKTVTLNVNATETTNSDAEFATIPIDIVFPGDRTYNGVQHPVSQTAQIYPCNFGFRLGAAQGEINIFDPLDDDLLPHHDEFGNPLSVQTNRRIWGPSTKWVTNDFNFDLNGSSIRQVNGERSSNFVSRFVGTAVADIPNNLNAIIPKPNPAIIGLNISNPIASFRGNLTLGSSVITDVSIFIDSIGTDITLTHGVWSSGSSYVVGNTVSYVNPTTNALSKYICIANVGPSATPPLTDTVSWQLRYRELSKEDYKSWIGMYVKNDYATKGTPFKFNEGNTQIIDLDPDARTITLNGAVPNTTIDFNIQYTFRLGQMFTLYTCDLTTNSKILRNVTVDGDTLSDWFLDNPTLDHAELLGQGSIWPGGFISQLFFNGERFVAEYNIGQTRTSWSAASTYSLNDVVEFSGSIYLCIAEILIPTINDPSVDTDSWELFPINSIALQRAEANTNGTFEFAFNPVSNPNMTILTRAHDFHFSTATGSSILRYVYPKPEASWVGRTVRNLNGIFTAGSTVISSIDVSDPLNYKVTLTSATATRPELKQVGIYSTTTLAPQSLTVQTLNVNTGGTFGDGNNIVLANMKPWFTFPTQSFSTQPFRIWARRLQGTLTTLTVFFVKGFGLGGANEKSETFNTKRGVIQNGELRGSQNVSSYQKQREPSHCIVIGVGSKEILFKDITGGHVYGDLIYYGAGLNEVVNIAGDNANRHHEAYDITFDNVHLDTCGRQGFTWNSGIKSVFKNGSLSNIGRHTLDVEPTAQLNRMLDLTFQNSFLGQGDVPDSSIIQDQANPAPRKRIQPAATFVEGSRVVRLATGTPWTFEKAPKNVKGFHALNIGSEILVMGSRPTIDNTTVLSNLTLSSNEYLEFHIQHVVNATPAANFLTVAGGSGTPATVNGSVVYNNVINMIMGTGGTPPFTTSPNTETITVISSASPSPHNGGAITLGVTLQVTIPKEAIQYLIDVGLIKAADIVAFQANMVVTGSNTTEAQQTIVGSNSILIPALTNGVLASDFVVSFPMENSTWTPTLSGTAVNFSTLGGLVGSGFSIDFSLSNLYDKSVLDDFSYIIKVLNSTTAILNKPAKKDWTGSIVVMPYASRRDLKYEDCTSTNLGWIIDKTWQGIDEDGIAVTTSGFSVVRCSNTDERLYNVSPIFKLPPKNEDITVTDNHMRFLDTSRTPSGKNFALGYKALAVSIVFTGTINEGSKVISNVTPTPDSSWLRKKVVLHPENVTSHGNSLISAVSGTTITMGGFPNLNGTPGPHTFRVTLITTGVFHDWKTKLGNQLGSFNRLPWSPRTPWVVLRNDWPGALDDQTDPLLGSQVSLSVSDNNPAELEEVTISGVVSLSSLENPPPPLPLVTGQVDILDGQVVIDTIILPTDGSGTFETELGFTDGLHNIRARYSGNAAYTSSDSTTRFVIVGPLSTFYGNDDRVENEANEITYSEMFVAEWLDGNNPDFPGEEVIGVYGSFNLGAEASP